MLLMWIKKMSIESDNANMKEALSCRVDAVLNSDKELYKFFENCQSYPNFRNYLLRQIKAYIRINEVYTQVPQGIVKQVAEEIAKAWWQGK